MLTIFEVGKPYPGAYPIQEGAVMELYKDGLTVLIQFPRITSEELKAFKNSFNSYSYFESGTPIPIPVFVFPFLKPFGAIDVNFNARVAKKKHLENYLSTGGNAIYFHLLDGNILKANKLVGLDHKAVNLFKNTIKKQLQIEYNTEDYSKYLDGIYKYNANELFKMGQIFHKSKSVITPSKEPETKNSPENEIIEKCLHGYTKKGMEYHSPLPDDLAKWYCYTIDGGHSILSIVKIHYADEMVFTDYLIPCPVKAVLEKGYEIKNGFVIVDLPYSREIGLDIEDMDEF